MTSLRLTDNFYARMPSCARRWWVHLHFCLGLLLLGGVAGGCRTAPALLFTAAGPDWRQQQGQAVWRFSQRSPEISGEVVLCQHPNGSASIQFSKSPVPLVLAQTSPTRWHIEFPPRKMSFSGPNPPPLRFAWLYVATAVQGRPLPPEFHFESKDDSHWKLANTQTGEYLEGYLEP